MHTKQYSLYNDTSKEYKMIPIKGSETVVFGAGEKSRGEDEE